MRRNRLYCHAVMCITACAAVLFGGTASANPTAPVVVTGQVTFNTAGNTLIVTNQPGAIINWQAFSIGPSEVSRFVQQSGASTVLNRVVGVNPSAILGSLQSNGIVFLINPNGVLFGASSQINVGALVISSVNITDANFLSGGGATIGTIIPLTGNISISGLSGNSGNIVLTSNAGGGVLTFAGGALTSNTGDVKNIGNTSVGGGSLMTAGSSITSGNISIQNTAGGTLSGGAITVTSAVNNAGGASGGAITLAGGSGANKAAIAPAGNIPGSGLSSNPIVISANGGAMPLANAAPGSATQSPQFVFGDTSNMKVVENRDVRGSITGWSLSPR